MAIPMQRIPKTPEPISPAPQPRVQETLPSLGVHQVLNWTSATLPRMQWMSSAILDHLEANQELLNDPLRALPPNARALLLELPHIAWVTVALMVVDFLVMLAIVLLSEFGLVYRWVASALLTLCVFVMFTVEHDAAHGSISKIPWINGLVGRLSAATMGTMACFAAFRTLHQMHHKFTNDPTRDPDCFVSHGGYLTLPVRCLLMIPSYLLFYSARLPQRPLLEVVEFTGFLTLHGLLLWTSIERGFFLSLLAYWILPSYVASAMLGLFFDFIPHHHATATPVQSRYHTTSILQTYQFAQPILSLLLQYQDYHLIHHLYPTIPFYRYADKWQEKQRFLREKQIDISHLTVEEVVKTTRARVEAAHLSMGEVVKNTRAHVEAAHLSMGEVVKNTRVNVEAAHSKLTTVR